jgi:hypothetical protein
MEFEEMMSPKKATRQASITWYKRATPKIKSNDIPLLQYTWTKVKGHMGDDLPLHKVTVYASCVDFNRKC